MAELDKLAAEYDALVERYFALLGPGYHQSQHEGCLTAGASGLNDDTVPCEGPLEYAGRALAVDAASKRPAPVLLMAPIGCVRRHIP